VSPYSKVTASPNATGLQIGFWEVNNKQAVTLQKFGKRPTSRVGFESWDQIETAPGVYNFEAFNVGAGKKYTDAHRYGETIYAAVNVTFTRLVTPDKHTIPEFYNPDPKNSDTRAAAKRFVYAYVQNMLRLVGSVVLTIDYEIVSNYRLSVAGSEQRAADWGAWYVEAAATARQAAADLGRADQLKLQPIVNGNPFEPGNPIAKGPSQNAWLVNAVQASDYLALDTYFTDPNNPVLTDATRTIDIIRFWIDNYAANKEVIVTENGFNTVTEVIPSITRAQRSWKTTGTEADQAGYFQDLFAKLMVANAPGGFFKGKLRSFNVWSVIDNGLKPADDEDRYFGVVRLDGSEKPGASSVRLGIANIDASPVHRPFSLSSVVVDASQLVPLGEGLVGVLPGAAGVAVVYRHGNDFDFVRYEVTPLAKPRHTLSILLDGTADVVVKVNDRWLYQADVRQTSVDVTAYCFPGRVNTVELYVTGPVFPVNRTVLGMNLVSS
jgi:hypothetical protein